MSLKTFFSTFFVIQMFALSSFANIVTCNRVSDDKTGFTTHSALNGWFPKVKTIEAYKFEDAGGGSKQMIWSYKSTHNAGMYNLTVAWRLLPNGTMIGKLKPKTGAFATTTRRYKCDKNSNEVRALTATNKKLETERQKCIGGQTKFCTQSELCSQATSGKWMKGEQIRSWETNERWARHVAEAKARGYSCGVTEVSEKAPVPKPTNSSVTKLEKAKVQCSELGFTAGTEKHGECVLKVIDY